MKTADEPLGDPIIRVGVQPYLTARPLVKKLDTLAPDIHIITDTPRQLTNLLSEGQLDVALIPLLTALRKPELAILPDISISTKGPDKHAVIFSKVAISDIKTILVDRSSINAIGILRALFRIRWSMQPVEVLSSKPIEPDYPFLERDYDAYMVIGDNVLKINTDFEYVVDIGEQWEQWTHLPLVHAVWGLKPGFKEGIALDELFLESKKLGLEQLDEIAAEASQETGIEKSACLDALKATCFDLGEAEFKGIERFHYFLQELKICEPSVELNIYKDDRFEKRIL